MFLRRLVIEGSSGVVRSIAFHKGMNLIVDERSKEERQKTGNNVGKTTVLRLVDYCFGSKGYSIYMDTEFPKLSNTTIQDYLTNEKILITMELVCDIQKSDSEKVVVKRNFLKRERKIQQINGKNYLNDKEFGKELKRTIFQTNVQKPTLREIISKNIRVETDKLINIIKVLGPYASKNVYEALYLFWMGIEIDTAEEKKELTEAAKSERLLRNRFRKQADLSLIKQRLEFHNGKIDELQNEKDSYNLNEAYMVEFRELNRIKLNINKVATKLTQLEIRKDLTIESKNELEDEYTNVNINKIKSLYKRAKALSIQVHRSYENTVNFHNQLISEKVAYLAKNLPIIDRKIDSLRTELYKLRSLEFELTEKLKKSSVKEELEQVLSELLKHYEKKGSLEEQKMRWEESNQRLNEIEQELAKINLNIGSKDELIHHRVTQFNKFFAKMSETLYNDSYLLSPIKKDAVYDLRVTNIEGNPSAGKKKGQIAAFDFAYIQFADELNIKCLHFIMHDQLENIHDNQLNTLIEVANNLNGQYIVPILRDKVPSNIDVSKYQVLSLSEDNKLFKVL